MAEPARPTDPLRLQKLLKFAAVQVAIAHAMRTLPPAALAQPGARRLHAILSGVVAMMLVGLKGEYTPAYRKLIGDHIAPRHAFAWPVDSLDTPCDKIHEGGEDCGQAIIRDLPTMAKRIVRFYAQLYLIQAVIGIAARGRGKVDWDALKRLPTNILGSIGFFLTFATLQRLVTCYVAPRPVQNNLLAYGVLTAAAAKIASNFEVDHRLVSINKLMIGYIVQEFLPGPGLIYLIGIAIAYSSGTPTAEIIPAAIAANFQ